VSDLAKEDTGDCCELNCTNWTDSVIIMLTDLMQSLIWITSKKNKL